MDGDVFVARLRAALREAGLKQKELAKALGLDVTTVNGWCRGRNMPNTCYLPTICRTLCVSADWLLGIEWEE